MDQQHPTHFYKVIPTFPELIRAYRTFLLRPAKSNSSSSSIVARHSLLKFTGGVAIELSDVGSDAPFPERQHLKSRLFGFAPPHFSDIVMPNTVSVRSERSAEISQRVWRTDQTNPFNWPRPKKWRITLAAAAVTFLVGLNSTAVTTPGHVIAETFRVDERHFPHSFWPVTVWNTGAAFGSIIGMPLLENFGSRKGYLVIIRLTP